MIYTLQRWPDVLTNIIEMFTDNRIIVLKEKEGKLNLLMRDEDQVLPLQRSVSLFLSQPSARRNFSKHALDNYEHYVVDVKKGLVCLATAEQAKGFISATINNGQYEDIKLAMYESMTQLMMRHWINAQMEYLPLDDDEYVTIYPLSVTTG
jgi:hypothetical protein